MVNIDIFFKLKIVYFFQYCKSYISYVICMMISIDVVLNLKADNILIFLFSLLNI